MHTFDGEVAHDEALVHEGKSNAAGESFTPEKAGGIELGIRIEVGEGKAVAFWQPAPPFADASEGVDACENGNATGEIEHNALKEVGKDHCRLPAEGYVGPEEKGNDGYRVEQGGSRTCLR